MSTMDKVNECVEATLNNHGWILDLLVNVSIYALVLTPMVIIVVLVKKKVHPFSDWNFLKVFVYGKDSATAHELKPVLPVRNEESSSVQPKSDSMWTLKNLGLFSYCFIGLQVSFLTYGVLQEKVMTTEYEKGGLTRTQQDYNCTTNCTQGSTPEYFHFKETEFLVFMNRTMTFTFALISVLLRAIYRWTKPKKRETYSVAPMYKFVHCSLSNILSSWCQNEALKYVNYPTQVLSKSCKIIPVMIMSKFTENKSYPCKDYVIAALLSIGVAIFLFGTQTGGHASTYVAGKTVDGIFILILFLTFDSFSSNWQGKLFKEHKVKSTDLMLYASFYSVILTLSSLMVQGTFIPSMNLMLSSMELTWDCLLFALCSAIGQLFVYYTISVFGPVVFVTTMTVRQALSILLSCLIYKHSLTSLSFIGLFVVFPVLFAQIILKFSQRKRH